MLKKYCEKLELNKVLNIVETLCITEVSKSLLKNLTPSNNKLIVKHLLSETSQARNLLNAFGNPPISEINENSKLIKLLESNSTLSCGNLLFVRTYFKIIKRAKKLFYIL